MKINKALLILLSSYITLVSNAQDFAPIGAKWHYTEKHAFSGDLTFLKIESVGDTILKGKKCNILEDNAEFACGFSNKKNYVYYEDSVAYFYVPQIDTFQMLYDLNAKQDSSWTIVFGIGDYDSHLDTFLVNVKSVGSVIVNSKKLKKLNVYYESLNYNSWDLGYNGEIIERIGDIRFLFNLTTLSGQICDGNYSAGLRCYQDADLGLYSTGIAVSCEYTYEWTNIDNEEIEPNISVFPNPTTGILNVRANSFNLLSAEIMDLTGKTLQTVIINNSTEINIENYEAGIYILCVKSGNEIIENRKIMKY